ncbi:hypothetical protein BH10BAC3_BH10BAC3_36550 [soil metagenome]
MLQIKKFIKYIIIFYLLIAVVYWIFIPPAYMNWGATSAEIKMKLPGDELISSNRIVSTRAINIHAKKEKIWPWFAQTGQNRGGFNSYYWLENLFGAKMVNANMVHPEWQNPQPGDTVYYGKNQGYALVALVKKNEYYSLSGWTFYLHTMDTANTRLIVRYPSMEVKQSKFTKLYYYGLFEPLHFIMETGMMMGIKQKAERQ